MPIDKVTPVKALVQDGLYLLMEPLGFTLEGINLIKYIQGGATRLPPDPPAFDIQGGATQLLEFQVDPKVADRFRVGLGVHYPKLMQQILGIPGFNHFKEQLKPLRSSACAFQQDLSEVALGKARWWKVETSGPNLKKLVEKLTILILEGALPWFQARTHPSALLQDPHRDDIFALLAAKLSNDETVLQETWRRFQCNPENEAKLKQVERFLWPT